MIKQVFGLTSSFECGPPNVRHSEKLNLVVLIKFGDWEWGGVQ